MIGVHSQKAIREAEDAFFEDNPDTDFLRVAGKAVAKRAEEIAPEGIILVVAGAGNNGGDGLHAGAFIGQSGRPVSVWLTEDRGVPGGVIAARQAGVRFVGASAAMRMLPEVSLVIDAVYGLRGRPGLPAHVARFAAACRDLGVPVLSVDLPSGLTADRPVVDQPCFAADWTTTFIAPKLCHVTQPASAYCGTLEVIDIGIEMPESDIQKMEPVDVARWWPWPSSLDDKYSRGVLGIDTGSERYLGAALLSTQGAIYSGAGMVRYVGPKKAADLILTRLPSVTIGEGEVQAWLAGCGWAEHGGERMATVLNADTPAVMDAEALDHLPERLPQGWLLTPHAGELARMLDVERSEIVADPIGYVRHAAERFYTTVLLKGASQYVAEPDGRVTIAVGGPAWSAQAGSGDVLSGICGTLLASGLPAWQAGAVAASIQAMTAEAHKGPYPPDELAAMIPETLAKIEDLMPRQINAAGTLPSELQPILRGEV